MLFAPGWLWVVVGFILLGNGLQEYIRHRQGRDPVGTSTPVASLLTGLGLLLLGILGVLSNRGKIPFWLYFGPVLLAVVAFVHVLFENYQRRAAPTRPPSAADSALTPWERRWKVANLVLSAIAMVAALVIIGTLAGARTAVVMVFLFAALWFYLGYHKKKHGYPVGSRERTV